MHHMQQHVTMMSKDEEEVDPVPSCSHCFRNFPSSSKLQCHLEAVHIYSKSVGVYRQSPPSFPPDSQQQDVWGCGSFTNRDA